MLSINLLLSGNLPLNKKSESRKYSRENCGTKSVLNCNKCSKSGLEENFLIRLNSRAVKCFNFCFKKLKNDIKNLKFRAIRNEHKLCEKKQFTHTAALLIIRSAASTLLGLQFFGT